MRSDNGFMNCMSRLRDSKHIPASRRESLEAGVIKREKSNDTHPQSVSAMLSCQLIAWASTPAARRIGTTVSSQCRPATCDSLGQPTKLKDTATVIMLSAISATSKYMST